MSVTVEKLDLAIEEAQRFIIKAVNAKNVLTTSENASWMNPKETGAVRRASMDLTRSLVPIRQ